MRIAKYPARLLMYFLLFALIHVSEMTLAQESTSDVNPPRPNILLIVADDLGYADLGVHGSDIRTPNIDQLAKTGVLFTRFHTAPMCSPTRSMLLSGNNNHVAGVGRQHPSAAVKDKVPGYEGHLSDRVAALPAVLQAAGYHTYLVGKWHLGTEAEHSPKAAGFERSFGVVEGAASHFDGRGFENAPTVYREDGELTEWPSGQYSTALYTDKLLQYLEQDHTDGQPFFAMAAYTSPHWPLQVPTEELDRYTGVYDAGYDALREKNFSALKAAGIVPATSALPPRNEAIKPWGELSAEQQRKESRKMELYAAMVENLDGHVGRLVDYLKQSGQYDNTLVVFMSDNGAAGNDFYNHGPYVDYIRERFNNEYGNMGGPDSFVSYGVPWAEAGSAPFKRYKGYTSEGGIVAALIVSGDGVAGVGRRSHAYVTVMDLAPSFIALAGAHYPQDGTVQAMRGSSMLPLLQNKAETVHDDKEVTVLLHRGNALVRQGPWKLTAIETVFSESQFALYNLDIDPGETTDLSDSEPEKYAALIEIWRQQRLELGIILPQDL
ncbi:MAG TPA: arylsulfatase [Xanthomonadales bacterium]